MTVPSPFQLKKRVDEFDGLWKVRFGFAWLPVLIRERDWLFGFTRPRWVWFRGYTRVFLWSPELGRYKTFDTFLGHQCPIRPEEQQG